ncbi:hypothetical protein E1287_37655 [Actinomadura sp. KC06]|uniref:hypothetical protein n=1 Tax=Actinomadura sp. KC06 TaxID=2530369 RepID=UPI001044F199|nr:hypothetical protein [Actinomadura sp. KC06]TDD25060.1 hypothetical protein E1287_37655 [Actinomadura sp. KC06]
MTDEMSQGVELAMLRGEVMTSLASIQGDIRLVLQEQQTAARRTDDLQRDVRGLDNRVDDIDRTRVTRDELDQRDARIREDGEKRDTRLREEIAEQRAADQKRADRKTNVTAIVVTLVLGVITIAVGIVAIIAR